jgi:hypothetical protein
VQRAANYSRLTPAARMTSAVFCESLLMARAKSAVELPTGS